MQDGEITEQAKEIEHKAIRAQAIKLSGLSAKP
jgi:hypothetical protein